MKDYEEIDNIETTPLQTNIRYIVQQNGTLKFRFGGFLKIIENSYPLNIKELLQETSHISELNDFLISNEIEKIWDSLIKNVDYNKYIAQFHRWFDGLKTIKFLKYFSN